MTLLVAKPIYIRTCLVLDNQMISQLYTAHYHYILLLYQRIITHLQHYALYFHHGECFFNVLEFACISINAIILVGLMIR